MAEKVEALHHIQSIDGPQRPYLDWVLLTPETFFPGSIGSEHFPLDLLNKRRPKQWLERPAQEVLRAGKLRTFVGEQHIHSVHGLLNVSWATFAKQEKSRSEINAILKQMAISPHARLLADIFGTDATAIPLSNDKDILLISAVNAALETMLGAPGEANYDVKFHIVQSLYGLDNGLTHNRAEIAPYFGVSDERIKTHAKDVKHFFVERLPGLTNLFAFPLGSIGRLLGYEIVNDLPDHCRQEPDNHRAVTEKDAFAKPYLSVIGHRGVPYGLRSMLYTNVEARPVSERDQLLDIARRFIAGDTL